MRKAKIFILTASILLTSCGGMKGATRHNMSDKQWKQESIRTKTILGVLVVGGLIFITSSK